jgi:hypothetical protein
MPFDVMIDAQGVVQSNLRDDLTGAYGGEVRRSHCGSVSAAIWAFFLLSVAYPIRVLQLCVA